MGFRIMIMQKNELGLMEDVGYVRPTSGEPYSYVSMERARIAANWLYPEHREYTRVDEGDWPVNIDQ